MGLTNFLQVMAGVGLFLFGIKLLSDALQFLAGERMRRLVGTLTKTPVRGVVIGALVTILIQSSSGVTVMTVSFVNTGLMTLNQAIGVIMGANIGTTVTAQIIAFKIKDIALPFIAVGAFMALLSRHKRRQQLGSGMVGFGMIFLGMQTMENSMVFLRDSQEFFLALSGNPALGVLAGVLLTVVVQSSAATIGLTIAMASQGLLNLDAAIPIILGDNIGTTITAVVASLGANRSAQQTAAAHVMFNSIGVLIFILFLPLFKQAVMVTSSDIGRQLANSHSMFNILNTLLFLPFVSPFARLIRTVLPDKADGPVYGPKYLDKKLLSVSPAVAVDAVRDELVHMGEVTRQLTCMVRRAYEGEHGPSTQEFLDAEKAVDELNRAISKFAAEVWQGNVTDEMSAVLTGYVSSAGDLERIGDHLKNLMSISEYKNDNQVRFTPQADAEFRDMFATVEETLIYAVRAIDTDDASLADKVIDKLEVTIDAMEKEYRKKHIERITTQECDPERGVLFVEALSNLERIGDHAHNIAYFARDNARAALGLQPRNV